MALPVAVKDFDSAGATAVRPWVVGRGLVSSWTLFGRHFSVPPIGEFAKYGFHLRMP